MWRSLLQPLRWATVLLTIATCVAADDVAATTKMTIAQCHAAGFDPYQLACETCKLLPTKQDVCRSCCQTYKSTQSQTHRYAMAVIGHAYLPSYYPEVQSFLDEDLKDVQSQKRLIVKRLGSNGYSQKPMPSVLMFLDGQGGNSDPEEMDIFALQRVATEMIVLDGWKRDDIRDMLKALLRDDATA